MPKKDSSRRGFICKVGKTLFSITVVGCIASNPKYALACGEGTTDDSCGTLLNADSGCGSGNKDDTCSTKLLGTEDKNCSVEKDPDNSCSNNRCNISNILRGLKILFHLEVF